MPAELHGAGVQRYGFHGLSYEYIAEEFTHLDASAPRAKAIVLHLGNGSSMCAMEGGRSVATTMGFTPADGLPMGTRCGTLDPGVVLYLMEHRKMDVHAIERLLYEESGLLGVSGVSSDMRELLASAAPSGAAFDSPDLLVAVVVGDGEAETGPLATSWHSTKFLNPIRDGAVLPILHLNGYKINNPTLLSAFPVRSWPICSGATGGRRISWKATIPR